MYNLFIYYSLSGEQDDDYRDYPLVFENGMATLKNKLESINDIESLEQLLLRRANGPDEYFTRCKLVNFIYM